MNAWQEIVKRLDEYCFKHNISYQISCNVEGKWSFVASWKSNPIVRVKKVENLFSALYFGMDALKKKFGGNYEIRVDHSDFEELENADD